MFSGFTTTMKHLFYSLTLVLLLCLPRLQGAGESIELSKKRLIIQTVEGADYTISGLPGIPSELRTFTGTGNLVTFEDSLEEFANGFSVLEDGVELPSEVLNAEFDVSVDGESGKLYTLEFSYDLEHWDVVSSTGGFGSKITLPVETVGIEDNFFARFLVEDVVTGTGNTFVSGNVSQTLGGDLVFGSPIDSTPLDGVTVRIPELGLETTTSFGSFFFSNLPVGNYKIEATFNGERITTDFVAVAGKFISVGGDRSAVETQIMQLVNGADVNGTTLSPAVIPAQTEVLGLTEMLPSGTRVVFTDGLETGNITDGFTLLQNSWLFMLDPYPFDAFPHPVYYVTIDNFDNITIHKEFYRATINESYVFENISTLDDPRVISTPTAFTDVSFTHTDDGTFPTSLAPPPSNVAPPAPEPQSLPTPRVASESAASSDDPVKTWSIVYSLGSEEMFTETAHKVIAGTINGVERLTPAGSVNPSPNPTYTFVRPGLGQIVTQYNGLGMNENDVLFVYMAGHGSFLPGTSLPLGRITNDNGETVDARMILEGVAHANACSIYIFLDTCYAGSLLRPPNFTAAQQATLDADRNSVPSATFEELAPQMISEGTELLVVGAADWQTTSKYADRWHDILGFYETGGQFTLELLNNDLLGSPGLLRTVPARLEALRDDTSTSTHSQNAQTYYLAPRDPDACGKTLIDQEEGDEPNDTSIIPSPITNIINGGDGDDEKTTLVGTLTPDDVDYLEIALPLNLADLDFLKVDVQTYGDVEIFLPPFSGDDEGVPVSQAFINLDDISGDSVTIGIGNLTSGGGILGDTDVPYIIQLSPSDPATGIVLNNVTDDSTFAMLIETNEFVVNEGNYVIIKPGETFLQYFDGRITGFNIVNFHPLSNPNPFPFDQGLNFTINPGNEQVYNFGNSVNTFFQSAIFTN